MADIKYYPKVVPTRMSVLSNQGKKELHDLVCDFRFEYLKEVHKTFLKKGPSRTNRTHMVEAITNAVSWKTQNEFDAWITTYQPEAQKIIYALVMYGEYPEEKLRISKDKPLCIKDTNNFYYYGIAFILDPDLQLNSIFVKPEKNKIILYIPPPLRKILLPWFDIPNEYSLSSCKLSEAPAEDLVYNNEKDIVESLPLLAEVAIRLKAEAHGFTELEKILKGLGKKQRTELLKQTGFKTFSPLIEHSPFAEDLSIRFLLCVTGLSPSKITNTYDDIKKLIDYFFDESKVKSRRDSYRLGCLESFVLLDHLTKRVKIYYSQSPPISRKIFLEILKTISKEGDWFDAEKLSYHALFNNEEFTIFNFDYEVRIGLSARAITIDGITYTEEYNDVFNIEGFFKTELFIKPLFKAYCYLFASLGILEITQKQPELRCLKREKNIPLSDYDSLSAIRVTEFGKWCMGVSQNKPEVTKNKFEAIADKELLLVTVKGNSLALTLLLDKIGSKLGDNRWRVSCSSFLSGCKKKEDITDRIDAFKSLIDKSPSPVWEKLFKQTLDNYGFFSANLVDGFIFNLDAGNKTDKIEHQKMIEDILSDPRIKGVAMRTEGRMLVVPEKHKNVFLQILTEHGVLDRF
ncbi:MAG: hypothetical protein Ta2G_17600 [Termitinemataceae bacterium]|nr:MAG: hypothetical protein Ta2G_17600 [Termitinemataceae bacterium]